MADFAPSPMQRDQIVLFTRRLDDVLAADHEVRLLNEILEQVDWSAWEAHYDLTRGQPPIHPRVIASTILYGLLKRIRTSRALEEALEVRNDFRWLVEGRSIDHTTIAKFRQHFSEELKQLFVQIALIAREMGHLPLATLGFDGTRIRANNRKGAARTPEELRQAKAELEAKFNELEAKTAEADAEENERLGEQNGYTLDEELADVKRRREQIEAALAELQRLEDSDENIPRRIPTTDPECRMTPNKEGGFAPNYTPLVTVDIDSGIVVDSDVIADTQEDKALMGALENVQENFDLEQPPEEVLADGMMSTGENLEACAEKNIELYAPIKLGNSANNPARREDPTQPVPEEQWSQLPVTRSKRKDGSERVQFSKDAFVYNEEEDSYRCPTGKELKFAHRTSQTENGRRRVRYRYQADPADCAGCPLAQLCLGPKSNRRQISHEQHEKRRIAHAEKMATEEAKEKYARRRHAGERPFAMIKGHFGIRQFLCRGLERVRNEWNWATIAFNLHRMISLIRSGTDPPESEPTS